MKKYILAIALVFLALSCYAQPADVTVTFSGMVPQVLEWDDITLDADGNPLLAGDVISYEVFFAKAPFVASEAVSLGVVAVSEATIDISSLSRGYYYVGVQAIGTDAGGIVTRTTVSWSNDPVAVSPLAQRFAYLVTGGLLLPPPVGLRTVNP